MARPLTKGRTIPVQLALGVDARVRRIASERGLSPGAYIAKLAQAQLDTEAPEGGTDDGRHPTGTPSSDRG